MSTDFSVYPESKIILPKSPVEIGGPLWKRHTPSYYLSELIGALRGAGVLEGKLGAGHAPEWFPSEKWSWKNFNNSSSGPIERKTDICRAILRHFGGEEGILVEILAREEENNFEGFNFQVRFYKFTLYMKVTQHQLKSAQGPLQKEH